MNSVQLLGRLTRDPELKNLPSGTAVVNIGVACNRRWKDQDGEKKEETTFVDCECFGKTAELINQYFEKGKEILIQGRLKLDKWQDSNGDNRSKLKVVVEEFHFVGSAASESQSSESSGNKSKGKKRATANAGVSNVSEDDIPF
jgi:single-strand DNA-binding protein